ncbi:oxygenase [Lithospermum erythrorhizon]|uniref:Oxygenase n=1 Tax=Lithospermum erythrorhizon TaxID=34254 RepID=A0AAV3Q3N7_LITER
MMGIQKYFILFFIFHVVAGNLDNGNLTALQKHVSFFDRNKDGIIYVTETFEGLRALGMGIALASSASVFINTALSQKTRPGEGFAANFPIVVKNIQLGKHGSDTDVYDEQGRFVEPKFEELFQKFARTHPNALTSDELSEMLKAKRDPNDYKGWIAAESEWKILYTLGKDDQGLLQKDTVRAMYDGSLFERIEKDRKSKNQI